MGGEAERTYIAWYFESKRTVCAQVSLYGLHRNVPHWGDPENFRPERFLLDGKVVQVDVFFSFSFLQKSELLSSHNFDKSELFSWHKFKSSRIHGCFHSPRANDVVLGSLWQSNATKRKLWKWRKDFQGHRVPDVLTGSSAFFLGTMFSAQVAIFRQCWRAYDWTTGILGNYKTINVEPRNKFRIYTTHWPSKWVNIQFVWNSDKQISLWQIPHSVSPYHYRSKQCVNNKFLSFPSALPQSVLNVTLVRVCVNSCVTIVAKTICCQWTQQCVL